jgi:hypothetical protein
MAAHAVQWLINVCLATVSSMPGGVGCLFGGGGGSIRSGGVPGEELRRDVT